MNLSLCKGKKTSQPNKCKKVRGCKVASGKKRTFCRKTHNKKNKANKTRKVRKSKMSEIDRLKGYTMKQVRELKKLR